MLASPRECEQGEKIMVSEEATPARYIRVLPQFKYVVKARLGVQDWDTVRHFGLIAFPGRLKNFPYKHRDCQPPSFSLAL
jgi:hypothetical protein